MKKNKQSKQNRAGSDNPLLNETKDTSPKIFQRPKLKIELNIYERELNEKQKQFIDIALDKNTKLMFVSGPAGTSKAQPLDALVLCESGYRKMGEINSGDFVFGEDGNIHKVLSIHPQGVKDVYKVSFSDGTTTECTSDHLWMTQTSDDRNERKWVRDASGIRRREKAPNNVGTVKTTEDILNTLYIRDNSRVNHSIPITSPIPFPKNSHVISPYMMGILLGDGCFRKPGNVSMSSNDKEIIDYISLELASKNMRLTKNGDFDYVIVHENKKESDCGNLIKNEIKRIGLDQLYSHEKFIPTEYLIDSIENRIDVLRGLMDSAGTVSKNGVATSFTSISVKLTEGIRFLVESLGGVCSTNIKSSKYTYLNESKIGKDAYITSICLPANINPFLLNRKADKVCGKTKYKPIRYIKSIEFVSKKECQCILVDSPSHLYLTNNFIVTHNTYISIYAVLKLLNLKKISDLLYLRSAVESSESKLGFLPGEASEKMAPYIQPLLEKLTELLPKGQIDILEKEQRFDSIPIGFLRGLNWNAKAIIADECISGEQFIQTENHKIKLKSLYKKFINGKKMPLINTFNEKTKCFESKSIISVVNKGERNTITVKLGNRNIVCTPDHKFLTESGWVDANELTPYTPCIANNEPKLHTLDVMNDDQFQIFIGSYLGDGSISKVGENRYRLSVIHGEKQKEYCQWKSNIFNTNINFIKENGFSKTPAFKFITKCFSLPDSLLVDNKKTCPQWLLNKLDARGIAIWYMDDGDINKTKNYIRIYTCSFDYVTQEKFVEKFKSFGIDCSINTDAGQDYLYYYLSFDKENSEKLLELISPYIHENLEYKIKTTENNKYIFNNQYKNYRHIIVDKVIKNNKREVVYDIEVADNHNFIITSGTRGSTLKSSSGVVVHNCQNMTQKELITLLTRTGEFSRVFVLGDPDQSDIGIKSGFTKVMNVFDDEESRNQGIHVFKFTDDDIVRSGLVKYIIKKIKNLT